ncbi:MAG: FRG domain-containing protein [Bauldia sp.]
MNKAAEKRGNEHRALKQREQWQSFLSFVERHGSAHWLFRGVADASTHLLIPKIGREPLRYSRAIEQVLFANFKRRASQFVSTIGLTDWDLLALAQHHGLPTRLLDWTKNPLVAAYFAVSGKRSDTVARVYAYQAGRIVDLKEFNSPLMSTASMRSSLPPLLLGLSRRKAFLPFTTIRPRSFRSHRE